MSLREFLWPDARKVLFSLVFSLPFVLLLLLTGGNLLIGLAFWVIKFYLLGCFLFSAKRWYMLLILLMLLIVFWPIDSIIFTYSMPPQPPCLGCTTDPATGMTLCCDPNDLLERLIELLGLLTSGLFLLVYVVLLLWDKKKKKPEAAK